MKADLIVEVCWSIVMYCLESVGEEFELCLFMYGELVGVESDSGC